MNSNIPWFADSTEQLQARASRIIGNTIPSELSLLPINSQSSSNFSSRKSLNFGQTTDDDRTAKKRKSTKVSKSQHQTLKSWNGNKSTLTGINNFKPQQNSTGDSSVRLIAAGGFCNRNPILSIPKALTDFTIYAVLFQQGMNVGSADAVAQNLRQRCVPEVVISSASSDFLGKVIESTLRITVGWEAYVEYTSYFFQFVPDGIFSLKSSQTVVDEERGKDLVIVQNIYSFMGSLVNTKLALAKDATGTSDLPLVEDSESEDNKISNDEILSSEDNDVKRIRLDLETNILREELLPLSSDSVENILALPDTIFQEDGLPQLNPNEEMFLFQSSEFLQDLVFTSSESSSAHDDYASITSISDITQDQSWEQSNIVENTHRPSFQTSSTMSSSKKALVLKPKHVPKVQNELAHNVIVDKELDIAERFLLDELERKVVLPSPGTTAKEVEVIDTSNRTLVCEASETSTSTTSEVPAMSPSVITSIDVIGAFNVYLNRKMQVEKLEFVYRNRCDI